MPVIQRKVRRGCLRTGIELEFTFPFDDCSIWSTPWRTSDFIFLFIDVDFGEQSTIGEGTISNGSDRARDGDAGEAGTVIEGIVSYGSDRVRDGDAGEAETAIEGIASDGNDRVRDGDAGEAVTSAEGFASYGSDSVRDGVVIRAFTTRISNDYLYILIK